MVSLMTIAQVDDILRIIQEYVSINALRVAAVIKESGTAEKEL